MILDDERQEGEWLKLRKKKTWTRNTERSLGSPENIAQWPMILKKKEKKSLPAMLLFLLKDECIGANEWVFVL